MPSSSGGGQTSTQKSEPWEGQKPYIQEGYKEAQDLYNKGPGQYYPGSTVGGFTDQTKAAQDKIYAHGMGADPTLGRVQGIAANNNYQANPVTGNLSGMATGGGLGASTSGRVGDIASNGGNVAGYTRGTVGDITAQGAGSNSQIRGDTYDLITGQAQANNPAFNSLSATANGNFVGANPYLDDSYARAAGGLTRQFAEGIAPGLDSAASRAGRYGSGMHANVKDAAGESFGRQLGDLATSMYGGAYNQERQNQLGAASTLGSQYLQGQGLRASTATASADQAARDAALRLQATGQVAGDMSGDVSRRLSASEQIGGAESRDAANMLAANQQIGSAYESGANRQMDALSLAPSINRMQLGNMSAALGIGQQHDTLRQQGINDNVARYDYGQNAEAQALQRYLAMIQGGNPSSTVTQTGRGGMGGLASLFAGAGGLGQLAMGTKGLLWGMP